jgi:hypothetical protein
MEFETIENVIDKIIDNDTTLGKYNDCEYFELSEEEKRVKLFKAIKEIPPLLDRETIFNDILEDNKMEPQFCIIELTCLFMELEEMGVTSLEGIKRYKVGEIEVELDKYYNQLTQIVNKYCNEYYYGCWSRC